MKRSGLQHSGHVASSRPAAGSRTAARAVLLGAMLAVLAGPPAHSLRGSSIFDDDWKPPPGSAKPVKPAEPPPPPPDAGPAAPPRLPPKPAALTPATPATPEPVTPRPITPTTPAAPAPLARAPLPGAAAVASAEKLIQEVFKTEYAHKTSAEKAAFARTLLGEAQQNHNDPPSLYVLLRDARDQAAAVGDADVSVEAARGLRDAFQMNERAGRDLEQLSYAAAVRGMASAPAGLLAYATAHRAADLGMLIAEYDLSEGDYAAAAAAAAAAEQAAGHFKDWEYPARLRDRVATIQAIAAEYEQDKAAFAALKSNPADPAANGTAGRFYTFFLDQPDRGMPFLAKGLDPTLQSLAARDRAAGAAAGAAPGAAAGTAATPATPDQQAAVAGAWEEAAKTQVIPQIKDAMQRRALFWYDQAAGRLEGLGKASVEKRAADLRLSRVQKGIAGHYFRGQDFGYEVFARPDRTIEFNWAGYTPEISIGSEHFSVRWEGYIKGAPGQYKLLAVHDDGARVWIDGKLVIDKWSNVSKESEYVQFTGNLQEFKVEYQQITGHSYMGIGWMAPKAVRGRVVPESALFHDPLPPGPIYTPGPKPDKDGRIVLTAAKADVHGEGTHFTQSPNWADGNIGWGDAAAWMSWDFTAAQGRYDVEITYACDSHSAGGQFAITVGNNRLDGTVVDTGGWGSERAGAERVGQVALGTGLESLRLRAVRKPSDSVMNLVQVTLTPVK